MYLLGVMDFCVFTIKYVVKLWFYLTEWEGKKAGCEMTYKLAFNSTFDVFSLQAWNTICNGFLLLLYFVTRRWFVLLYPTPPQTKFGGYIGFTLSVCLSVRIEGTWFVRATPPTVFLLGSFYFADHLYIYQRCACGKDFDFCAFLPKI